MSRSSEHEEALALCTYCPSLCLHSCPVSTVEHRDSVSPWGKMSMVAHVAAGRVDLDAEVASVFYKCLGCGACQVFCRHDNDVATVLFDARRKAVSAGVTPFPQSLFDPLDNTADLELLRGLDGGRRFERSPEFLLLPGHRSAFGGNARALVDFLAVCERLEDATLSLGEVSVLEPGYELWAAGYVDAFRAHALKVREAMAGARTVVVMSAEALFTLRDLYPEVGAPIDAQLMHTVEYLEPLVTGAIVERVSGRVGYHDSCFLARALGNIEDPRTILKRILVNAPIDLALSGESTECCGATGCLPKTSAATSAGAAKRVVQSAIEAGVERLVTFSPECVPALAAAAPPELRVEGVTTLLAQAVRGEGGI